MLPAQCRAARALLNITMIELAMGASVGLSTVKRFENETGGIHAKNVAAMRDFLAGKGVTFIRRPGVVGATLDVVETRAQVQEAAE